VLNHLITNDSKENKTREIKNRRSWMACVDEIPSMSQQLQYEMS
jgi:hypothetical protein